MFAYLVVIAAAIAANSARVIPAPLGSTKFLLSVSGSLYGIDSCSNFLPESGNVAKDMMGKIQMPT
eukprot:584554-Pelagomonas_calceolata.AAC.1